MGPGWQSLDLATRAMKIALRSVDVQKLPKSVAVIQANLNSLTTLITSYTTGTVGSTNPTPPPTDKGDSPSPDADAQPAMGADSAPASDSGGDDQ